MTATNMTRQKAATAFHIASPVGLLKVETAADALTRLHFVPRRAGDKRRKRFTPASGIEEMVADQLRRYFDDPQWRFTLPLQLKSATAFRTQVWRQLRLTSAGEVLTYTELAHKIKSHPRPVGGACRANPVPIVIPCHRIVPADAGSWPGVYCGSSRGVARRIKRWLLMHEANAAGKA